MRSALAEQGLPKMFLRVISNGRSFTRLDRMPPEKALERREGRLRKAVANAYYNTRFWKDWLDKASVKPDDIQHISDLSKIPICTKKDLTQRPVQDRIVGKPSDHVYMSTSGTTGGPMLGVWSKPYNDYFSASIQYRMRSYARVGFFGSMVRLSFNTRGSEQPSLAGEGDRPRNRTKESFGIFSPIMKPLSESIYKRFYFAYSIEEILPQLVDHNPDMIWGMTSFLRLLADCVNEKNITNIRPKAMFGGGDYFDEPSRKYIEETFGCPLLGIYGANEVGIIALECTRKQGMHMFSDSLIAEVLRDGKPVPNGEPGEFVVTTLLNDAMPMIRYNVQDIVIMSDQACECGRSTPIIRSIEGKVEDHFILRGGRTVSSRTLVTMMHLVKDLPRCQVVQEDMDRFRLRVFGPETSSSLAASSDLVASLGRLFGADATVTVTFEQPERLKAKFRPVVSFIHLKPGSRWVAPY